MPKPIAPSPINATFLGFSAACTILCWGVCSSSSVVLLFFTFGAATLMLIVFSHICTPMGEPVSNVVPYVKSWTQKIMNPKNCSYSLFPLLHYGDLVSKNPRMEDYECTTFTIAASSSRPNPHADATTPKIHIDIRHCEIVVQNQIKWCVSRTKLWPLHICRNSKRWIMSNMETIDLLQKYWELRLHLPVILYINWNGNWEMTQ